LLAVGQATIASAATFSNPAAITINDSSSMSCTLPTDQALASPYPSQIQVSGLGSVSDVNVTLNGFSHTASADVRVLLVGPHGQTTLLMHEVGGGTNSASNATLTFDDAAAGTIPPGPIPTGTYKPSQFSNGCHYPPSLSFPGPAPAGPYGTALAAFNATDPNGAWGLYVVDDQNVDVGSFSGGWSLDISPAPAPAPHKKCKKHKKHAASIAKKHCKKKK
jgi:subtilisin-like proprotein convertase family protein